MTPTDPSPAAPPDTAPALLWRVDGLRRATHSGTPWLWQGYLARGAVTLLTSQCESGKTTLAAVLQAFSRYGLIQK
jgi:hypothetical protein